MIQKNTAIVMLLDELEESTFLKKLSLIFDKIYYVRPALRVFKSEVLNDPNRYYVDKNNKTILNNFNFFNDTYFGLYKTDFKNEVLKDNIYEFEEASIIESLDKAILGDKRIVELLDILASIDISDITFNELCNTSMNEYSNLELSITKVGIELLDGNEKDVVVFEPPKAVSISQYTNSLLVSDISSIPVFINDLFRKHLDYKYKHFRNGLKILKNNFKINVKQKELDYKFGEIIFKVMNHLIDSNAISKIPTKKIIKLRNELDESRNKYISTDITELSHLLNENPWSSKTSNEIIKYIETKLKKDIISYNDKTSEIWDKFKGDLIGYSSTVLRDMTFAGGVGGLVGTIIPNTSTLEMALISAISLSFRKFPDFVKNIVDLVNELRKQKRSSLAFIASMESKLSS